MSASDGQEAFLARILEHCTCEVCSKPLARGDVTAIRRSESMWLINIRCTDCDARGIVFVLIREAAASRGDAPAATGGAAAPAAITVDDCRAMHEFLRSFDGDCVDLIRALG